ncbi:MAG TPA: phosphoribosylformylglycinamidine synthase I [Acidimicrobiaceae bacterium]|nr:phosphoribosylformylglycinamidine synthase I [Acidimicrobiaceae bacterium]
MSRPTALVLAAPGTNRDHDVAFALELAGAAPRITLLSELMANPSLLVDHQMLVVAGGFSYADALGAGSMWSLALQHGVADELHAFVAVGKPVLGICNGFQVLTSAGLLPGALGHNESGHFQCEWVRLQPVGGRSVWTAGLDPIECPMAHGEGRYVHPDVAALEAAGQVALRYDGHNPNGSMAAIAGVCDPTGVVLGLMPHPENHVLERQHPRRARGTNSGLGLHLFQRGVQHARER